MHLIEGEKMVDVTTGNSAVQVRPEVAELIASPRARVLVLGGGINGIATFRDLALQGIDVVLVERGDYCSGASAASSHMIHGGVRYLENGEFRLVRESVQERNRLLRLAPHYVKPLKTTIPIFSTFSGILSAPLRFLTHKQRGNPKERGALLIKVGLTGYDSFSRDGGNVPRHRFAGAASSKRNFPELRSDVKYTATYFDAAVVNPERLALDLVADARATGAHARSANYVEAIGTTSTGVLLRDVVSGHEFTVEADVVINTTGPWTDMTNSALGTPSKFMGGTKGSHIVLDNPELFAACNGGEVFFENNDGRIVLIYPLNGKVLVGTTDLEADIAEPAVCTDEEVEYFFELVTHVFPKIAVDRSQIVFRYSGIRPLPRHDETAPGFVSRDYRIERSELAAGAVKAVPMLSVVGGKWTTFRALAEHITNDTLAILGEKRTVSTESLAIGGGVGFPADGADQKAWVAANSSSVSTERGLVLLARYGTGARAVMVGIAGRGDAMTEHVSGFSVGELAYLASTESVVHITDVVLRRTTVAFGGGLSQAAFDEISALMAETLGWSPEQHDAERIFAVDELSRLHGLTLVASATSSSHAA
jgi:glycerol-3-phosphate dehydrogenase